MEDSNNNEDVDFEIERRFLVADRSIVEGCDWDLIEQAYVFSMDDFAVRVRLTSKPTDASGKRFEPMGAKVTVKGPRFGAKREEYETKVSLMVAKGIIDRSADVVTKRRYHLVTDQTWELDEFLGSNGGLWIGEIEGRDADEIMRIPRPDWASTEVTTDPRYNNENLAVRPYSSWRDSDSEWEE